MALHTCSSSPVSVIQMNPLALVMEDPHEYEDPHEHEDPHEYADINEVLGRLPAVPGGLTEEEVITTPCLAYISTTHVQPAQLYTMEYEVVRGSAPNPVSTTEGEGSANTDNPVGSMPEYENL